jgi:hypothetical protein
MSKNRRLFMASFAGLVMGLAVISPALANRYMGMPRAIIGTVTSVKGNTINVMTTGFSKATYIVDASKSRIIKNGVGATSVSSVKVGETVIVQGHFSGTNIKAVMIRDGKPRLQSVVKKPVANIAGW